MTPPIPVRKTVSPPRAHECRSGSEVKVTKITAKHTCQSSSCLQVVQTGAILNPKCTKSIPIKAM